MTPSRRLSARHPLLATDITPRPSRDHSSLFYMDSQGASPQAPNIPLGTSQNEPGLGTDGTIRSRRASSRAHEVGVGVEGSDILHSRRSSRPALSGSLYNLPSASSSFSSHGRSRRSSRASASLTALRSALHSYQISDDSSGFDPDLPSNDVGEVMPRGSALIVDTEDEGRLHAFDRDRMDALVDIHRVLYRGKEVRVGAGWNEQSQEIQRVMERWFEYDCAYDNPFAKVSSRQSLISHFILLHLVSCGQLPPLSSRSLFSLATSISKQVLGYANVIGDEGTEVSNAKGKEKAEIGLGIHHTGETDLLKNGDLSFETIKPIKGLGGAHQSDTEGGGPSWWRLWDVTAECRELGSIECYDGYHIAQIDQVVSFSIFPSIAKTPSTSHLFATSMSLLSLGLDDIEVPTEPPPSTSYVRRIMAAVAEELGGLLRWDLPISTVVEFNEVGKATHVRDVVDVRDAIETFVPFAKRFGWLSRRLTGMFSSAIGSLAMSMLGQSDVSERHLKTASRVRTEGRTGTVLVPSGDPGHAPGNGGLIPVPMEANTYLRRPKFALRVPTGETADSLGLDFGDQAACCNDEGQMEE